MMTFDMLDKLVAEHRKADKRAGEAYGATEASNCATDQDLIDALRAWANAEEDRAMAAEAVIDALRRMLGQIVQAVR